MSILSQEKLREVVKDHLAQKKMDNPRYSLRSLAMRWDLSPAKLSEFLNGKISLGEKNYQKIILQLPSDLRKKVISGDRKNYPAILNSTTSELVSDIYHFAILSFCQTPQGLEDCSHAENENLLPLARKIAKHFSFTVAKTHQYLKTLKDHHFMSYDNEKKCWKVEAGHLAMDDDLWRMSLRQSHQQSLLLASRALGEVSPEVRDFSSLTFRLKMADLILAREEIKVFRQRMDQLFETEEADNVYLLSINLFPLSKGPKDIQ
jgi:hypothetical protein